jgi:hypothetical protein
VSSESGVEDFSRVKIAGSMFVSLFARVLMQKCPKEDGKQSPHLLMSHQ